jgi:hypothetical protein
VAVGSSSPVGAALLFFDFAAATAHAYLLNYNLSGPRCYWAPRPYLKPSWTDHLAACAHRKQHPTLEGGLCAAGGAQDNLGSKRAKTSPRSSVQPSLARSLHSWTWPPAF